MWLLQPIIIKCLAFHCLSGKLLHHMLFFAELLFMFTERGSLAESQQQQVSYSRVIRNRKLSSLLNCLSKLLSANNTGVLSQKTGITMVHLHVGMHYIIS